MTTETATPASTDVPAPEGEGTPFKPDKAPAESKGAGRRRRLGKIRLAGSHAAQDKAPKPAKAAPPRPVGSISDGLTMLWGGAGLAVGKLASPPTGRVMQLQAPSAGKKLDKAIKQNARLYAWLYPWLGNAAGSRELAEVFGPPVLVYLLDQKPHLAPMLEPMLRSLLLPVLKDVVKQAKEAQEMQAEMTKAEAALGGSMDELLGIIFADDDEDYGGEDEEPGPPPEQPPTAAVGAEAIIPPWVAGVPE